MIDCSLTVTMALIGQAKLTGMHTSRLPNSTEFWLQVLD